MKKQSKIKGDIRAYFERLEKKAGSQKALAELLRVDPRTIRKWKSKQRGVSERNYEKVKVVRREINKWSSKARAMYKILGGSPNQFKARIEMYNQIKLFRGTQFEKKLIRKSPEIENLILYYIKQGILKK